MVTAGIDIGTSGVKILAMDETGKVLKLESHNNLHGRRLRRLSDKGAYFNNDIPPNPFPDRCGKARIQRSKGLGENEPDMMWETTMNPASRRLIKVVQDDIEKTQFMFDILLGDNIKGRKEFIEDYGHMYVDPAAV